MSDTSARLLELLSLLQTPRDWPGSELAERLGVSPRTVRRDVDRLRELGYPVQATMGAAGGYRLAAGTAMPPLLVDDEEAVAIAVGLRTAASHPVDGIEEASVRALAKLEQVLPARLRHRVGALAAATVPMRTVDGPPVDPQTLVVLAGAVANRERLRFAYRAADGTETRRLTEPYRLVTAGRRWYLLAYDNDRDDWRNFRVDRIGDPLATGVRVPARVPPEQDVAAFVTGRLYSSAPTYEVVATLGLPAEEVARRLGGAGGVEPIDERSCLLRGPADTLEWTAARLLMLGCEFEVREPPELVAYLRALGARATRAAQASDRRSTLRNYLLTE
ncbi:helix-turn-helix transcriptional regulator [Streptosporangium saharense]|uniref:Putative DNA-binding transcriptional regulator YafY n=1 Tax=Streptosporangium saharense TaxID=1706840 RepID=A0A7W7QRF2_9ACTN|nr:YafY family protein [Streptosporangium saharense]MBB4918380.1 putative DNA-binding transcriptional regulator YafY [Streptosporangium saharense]